VSGGGGPWDADALLARVLVTEAPALAEELASRLPSPAAPRGISVTDLLSPRRAFWRRLRGPAPVAVDRELRLEEGRRWHRRLGDALAGEAALEVRVRRGGVTARIDALADVPIEVKTGARAPDGSGPEDWPDQIEQLAAYCGLAENPTGRLAHLAVDAGGSPSLSVREFRFRDAGALRASLRQRAEVLREAIDRADPAPLDRCRWFARGCEYRTAGVCACTGEEAADPRTGEESVVERRERSDLAERWERLVTGADAVAETVPAHFRDLLYPRRAFFDRTAHRPPVAHAPRPPSAPLDAFERLHAALEAGPLGSVHRLATGPTAPQEEVLAWNGDPCVVRGSRVHGPLAPEAVRDRFPQYLLDLGFRCAVSGRSSGTVVVGYETPPARGPPVQVFRVEVSGGADAFASAWEARRRDVDAAVAEGRPGRLPPCPAWMARDCAYRDACGCGSEPARSQR
jgi:hypothetical protein